MEVSVIIPTYNRKAKVLAVLDALQIQHFYDFEIIVVIDGSFDDTEASLNNYQSRFPLKVIWQKNGGRAVARNSGAKLATGKILVFYDDDVLPDPASISKHVEFHKQFLNAAILAGNPAEYFDRTKTDFQNYKAFLCERWLMPYKKGLNELNYKNLFLAGANFSIKKKTFDELLGFSGSLSDNEDFDLAYRAISKDHQVWFDYNNIAIHDDPVTCAGYVRRLKQYVKSHSHNHLLYPNRAVNEKQERSKLKLLVYWIFSWPVWIKLIDNTRIFLIFPTRFRYTLYDIITFSQSEIFPRS